MTAHAVVDDRQLAASPHASHLAIWGWPSAGGSALIRLTFLFTGTMAHNIRLNETRTSDEEVRAAARYVNADEFISALPGGFDAPVRERVARLSVGEKQLIAFARDRIQPVDAVSAGQGDRKTSTRRPSGASNARSSA